MAITPTVLDTYSRFMDELFDEKEIIGVSTVWQQFFGKPANGGSKTIYSPNSEVVDIDIMRGNERTAALIHRGTDSRHLDLQRNTATQNFSSFSRVYPFAEELGDITSSQILKRMAGEDPYDNKQPNHFPDCTDSELFDEHCHKLLGVKVADDEEYEHVKDLVEYDFEKVHVS